MKKSFNNIFWGAVAVQIVLAVIAVISISVVISAVADFARNTACYHKSIPESYCNNK